MFSRSTCPSMVSLAVAMALLAPTACLAVLPDAVDKTANNVVRVKVGRSLASGVYVGNQYVLTARHLFDGEGTSQATATFRYGDEKVSGRLISTIGSDWDSAVIRLDREPATSLPTLTVSRDIRPGDVLWVGGYSSGKLVYRHGPVDGFRRLKEDPTGPAWYVQFNAPCYSGDSGGPMFLEDGTLVGTMWGSGGPCGRQCSDESHRTYSIGLCARFTRKLIGALFPGLKRNDCPPGGVCPGDRDRPEIPGEQPIAPWDGRDMPQPPPVVPGTPSPPSVDLTDVLAQLAALQVAVANIQLRSGEKGDKGDKGDPGNDGVSPVIDYNSLAAEVIKLLPPPVAAPSPEPIPERRPLSGSLILRLEPVY